MSALLALRLFGGRIFSALGKLNVWQILCILLGIALIVNIARADHWKKVATHRQVQVVALTDQLHRITTAKDTQKVVTRDRIRTVTQTVRVADGKAKAIETAPLPGNCRTPDEVLHADI